MPALFAYEPRCGTTEPAEADRIALAPSLTREGIWAATTVLERTRLRGRLTERLGADRLGVDQVAVVAARDRRRRAGFRRPRGTG